MARLMGLDREARLWPDSDMADLLRHQLDAPVIADLPHPAQWATKHCWNWKALLLAQPKPRLARYCRNQLRRWHCSARSRTLASPVPRGPALCLARSATFSIMRRYSPACCGTVSASRRWITQVSARGRNGPLAKSGWTNQHATCSAKGSDNCGFAEIAGGPIASAGDECERQCPPRRGKVSEFYEFPATPDGVRHAGFDGCIGRLGGPGGAAAASDLHSARA